MRRWWPYLTIAVTGFVFGAGWSVLDVVGNGYADPAGLRPYGLPGSAQYWFMVDLGVASVVGREFGNGLGAGLFFPVPLFLLVCVYVAFFEAQEERKPKWKSIGKWTMFALPTPILFAACFWSTYRSVVFLGSALSIAVGFWPSILALVVASLWIFGRLSWWIVGLVLD